MTLIMNACRRWSYSSSSSSSSSSTSFSCRLMMMRSIMTTRKRTGGLTKERFLPTVSCHRHHHHQGNAKFVSTTSLATTTINSGGSPRWYDDTQRTFTDSSINFNNNGNSKLSLLQLQQQQQHHRHSSQQFLSFSTNHHPSSDNSSTTTTKSTVGSSAADSVVDDMTLQQIHGEFGSYQTEYNRSITDPESFWMEAAMELEWFQPPSVALQPRYNPPTSPTNSTTTTINDKNKNHHPQDLVLQDWFPDGTINTCYNCVDVHVEKYHRGDQLAIVYDSPITNTKETYTYQELLTQVSQLAGAMKYDLGVNVGDRVVIYMPMIPEAVIAMLACARIGAIHSVVFGGFASQELATRITDCQPKIIISASAGVEPNRIVPYKPLLDKALQLTSHTVEKTIIVQRPNVGQECDLGPNDISYTDLMEQVTQSADAIPLPSTHPHYILYTSGTTGLPKGVVRDTGGMAVALKYSMNHFYGMNPGDVFWSASDIGWVVGHGYIVYGPLLHGCTTVLYEGKPVGTPDAGAFWRVISEHRVKAFFVAPTAFRAIKQADPDATMVQPYDLSCLETIFLAGEHSDPDTIHWCERAVPHIPPPIDHWWQTELGWPAVGNAVGLGRLPIRYGSCSMPVPGFQLEIIDGHGKPLPPNKLGNMVLKTPLAPGTLTTIYKDDDRYIREYLTKYPGYYDTGDAAYRDENGYVYIMGRTDDIINTAGHRLSTGAMEEILMEHNDVADCAVIAVNDDVKGQVPVGLVVCVAGTSPDEYERIRTELVQLVRDELGPVASFKTVGVVKALPKTRSGKTLRGTMSKIANGQPYKITPTIDDATIFDTLAPEIVGLIQSRTKS